jgi:kynurenine formamidase
MPLIDISPPLRVGMAVFPGDAAFRVAKTFTIAPGCPVNVAEIAMSTHCGAHMWTAPVPQEFFEGLIGSLASICPAC